MSTLKDLNAHLFAQLDKLAKSNKNDLPTEVERAKMVKGISAEIIEAHKTQLEAVKLIAEHKGLSKDQDVPRIALGDMSVEV